MDSMDKQKLFVRDRHYSSPSLDAVLNLQEVLLGFTLLHNTATIFHIEKCDRFFIFNSMFYNFVISNQLTYRMNH